MTQDSKTVALTYVEACGCRDLARVEQLLHPEVKFVQFGKTLVGAVPYLAVLRRLGPVWVRSDVKRTFVDGAEVCVIYDFVTDTEAGSIPIVEWLRVEDGLITSIHLFFDRLTFRPASDELARRAAG